MHEKHHSLEAMFRNMYAGSSEDVRQLLIAVYIGSQ